MAFTAMAPNQMAYANAAAPNPTYGGPGGPMPSGPALGTASPSPPVPITPPPPPGQNPGGQGPVDDMMVVPPGADYGTPNNPGYYAGNPNAPGGGQNPNIGMPGGPTGQPGQNPGAAGPPAGQGGQPPQTGWQGSNPWSQWGGMPNIDPNNYNLPGSTGAGGTSYSSGGNNPMVNGIGSQGDGTQYGGQTTVNPQAGQADYQSVQNFADQAYQQSRRYLDPQLEQQNRGLDQQLINQGIDPRSEYGQFMADQLARQQNDLNATAAFNALDFGQGIQNQMFDQDFNRAQLASDMQRAEWETNLGYEGENTARMIGNQNFQSNREDNQLRRYMGDQTYQLGLGNLDLNRRQESFDQMMGLEDLGYRQWMANEGTRRWDTEMAMNLAGMSMPPGQQGNGPIQVGGSNPYDIWGDYFNGNPSAFGG